MNRGGHYGISLILYSPITVLLLSTQFSHLVPIGLVILLVTSMLPDIDQRIPLIRHRTWTHTVWFAIVTGGGVGLGIGVVMNHLTTGGSEAILVSFAVFIGIFSVLTHLVADALTPMGVRPFFPLVSTRYSFSVCSSTNTIANYSLLVLGMLIFFFALIERLPTISS